MFAARSARSTAALVGTVAWVLLLPSSASRSVVDAQSVEIRLNMVPAPIGEMGETRELYSGSAALLIGVSQYQHYWDPLPTVPAEVESLRETLSSLGFDVVLGPPNPTFEQLKKAFEDFLNSYGYQKDYRLLVYFAGHGYSEGHKGYILASDAAGPKEREQLLRKAISMSQIRTWAEDIVAKHALFVFDSCFSGTVLSTRGDRPVPIGITQATTKPVRQFISAGGATERVPAKSVFTPVFTRGIAGDADTDRNGFITGSELGAWLKLEIPKEMPVTPLFGQLNERGHDGDFVFALPRRDTRYPPMQIDLTGLYRSDALARTLSGAGCGGSLWVPTLSTEDVQRPVLVIEKGPAEGEYMLGFRQTGAMGLPTLTYPLRRSPEDPTVYDVAPATQLWHVVVCDGPVGVPADAYGQIRVIDSDGARRLRGRVILTAQLPQCEKRDPRYCATTVYRDIFELDHLLTGELSPP